MSKQLPYRKPGRLRLVHKLVTVIRLMAAVFVCAVLLQSQSLVNQPLSSQLITNRPLTGKDGAVTAVEGKSWLNQITRTFNESSMGRTWSLGPAAPPPFETYASWQPELSPGFPVKAITVRGSDIYRFNCRGCHQETGLGAPPEINSIINPVRATSVQAILQRMKNRGIDMDRADAVTLGKQANAALLERIHKGGQEMPAFPYLADAEIRSLVIYLKQLAAVPDADKTRDTALQTTPLHIGEQIVKSTCHICHNATGQNPTPQQILDGAIPPLFTLTTRKALPEFVRKVVQGAPVTMGTPPELCRGRMSVFYYLSQDEAASAYLYLSVYPPHTLEASNARVSR